MLINLEDRLAHFEDPFPFTSPSLPFISYDQQYFSIFVL
jgi:hypothetical protein